MSFTLPTLDELERRAQAELVAASDSTPLRRNLFTPLARAQIGLTYGLYGYLGWAERQTSPYTCDDDQLEDRFGFWLERGRKPAAPATGQLRVAGSQAGRPIDTDAARWQSDAGLEYVPTADVIVGADGAVTVPVVCTTPGQNGNLGTDATLSIVNPIEGVASSASVLMPGLSGGADQESYDSFRARIIDRIQDPPQGGANPDYVKWALQVPGITRAWCRPARVMIGGQAITVQVHVLVMRDDDSTPFPDEAECAAVAAHIDTVRPVTADCSVHAPQPKPVGFDIALTPDTATTRAAVESSLRDFFRAGAEPAGTLNLSNIREAISKAAGEKSHVLYAPTDERLTSAGFELLTLGDILWR